MHAKFEISVIEDVSQGYIIGIKPEARSQI